jgi:hypothetical protein
MSNQTEREQKMKFEKALTGIQIERLTLTIFFALAILVGQGVLAGTITVTSTADGGTNSLRQALSDAAGGDTIRITAKGTIVLTQGELLVDKSVNILGPGAAKLSISGDGASRVFHIVPNVTVALAGLTIANGSIIATSGPYSSTGGGGVFSDHANLTISNCVISGNFARYGGGIFSNSNGGGSASLNIESSTLKDNSASFYGGGIFSGGGFANTGDSGEATLTINHTSLSNNTARFGGGIFNDGFSGAATLTLSNSDINAFPANPFRGSFPGAAIYNNGDSGVASVTVTNSTVASNPSETGVENTSGIYNDGTASISSGIATLIFSDSSVVGSSSFGHGGIFNDGNGGSAIVTINHSSFSGSAGIGLENMGLGGNATVNNSTFSHNFGGGVGNRFGTVTLNSSTLSENGTGLGSGGVGNVGGSATLNKSTVSGNSYNGIYNDCASLTLNESSVSGSVPNFQGSGIYSTCDRMGESSAVVLTDSIVNDNSHTGIFNYGAKGGTAIFTLINSTVSGNLGLGIYTSGVGEGSGLLILQNSTLSGNSTCSGCGAGGIQNISLYGGSSTVEVTNTIFNTGAVGVNLGSIGTFISHGYNLSSDDAGGDGSTGPGGLLNGPGDIRNTDPLLGSLKNNGGPTKTHALLLGSPAINAGDPNFDANIFFPPLLYDQRNGPGSLRVVNGRIDIGAYESKHP